MPNALERKLRLYSSLSDADQAWLGDAVRPVKQVPAGSDIVVEGDDPRSVCIILDGWAGRCRNFPDGRRQITSILLPGDSCDPYVFVFDRRDHTITALSHVAVAYIPSTTFAELQTRSSALERAFHCDALVSAAIQRELAASLGRRTGLERLAHLFCELHARLMAIGLAKETGCKIPLSQNDMADVLGQTSVHISRMLGALRETGLISLKDRYLTIHDAKGLARLAHFDPLYLHSLHAPNGAEFP